MGWEGLVGPGMGCSNGRMGGDTGKETWVALPWSPSALLRSRECSQGKSRGWRHWCSSSSPAASQGQLIQGWVLLLRALRGVEAPGMAMPWQRWD